MTLTLRAVSLNEQPLTQPITAHFDAQGGTIGRSDHNTLALPDPERHISRQQAEILAVGAGYAIKNVGSANPINVGSVTLSQGESAPLHNRAQVRIGGYLLEVVEEQASDATTITRGRATVEAMTPSQVRGPTTAAPPLRTIAGQPAANGSFGDLGGALSSGNPFADLIGTPTATPPPPPLMPVTGGRPQTRTPSNDPPAPATPRRSVPGRSTAERAPDPFAGIQSGVPGGAGIPASSAAWAPPPPAPGARGSMLPDDFDPFAPPPAAPKAAPEAGNRASLGAFGDLIPSSAPASIDTLYGLQGGPSARDPLADFLASAPSAPKVIPGAPLAPAPSAVSTDPFAMFGDATPKAREPVAAQIPSDHTPELRGAFVPPAVRNAPAAPGPVDTKIPTGFDWLGTPASTPSASPFGDLLQPAAPVPASVSVPGPLPVPVAVPMQPLSPPPQQPLPPAPVLQRVPTAPLEDEAPTMMARQAAAPVASPLMPAPRPAPQPAASVAVMVPPVMPATVAPAANADTRDLWAAFCEGAGVRLDPPQGLNPELMRVIGSLLRASVDGTVKLVAVRAATKHELRAQVTVIQARNNNPLKFSPDAQVALEQLLQPPVRGFLSGPAAMTDVMNDLLGHSIGTMAGMRAALDGVLDRFAPNDLEAKLAGKSMLDSVLPMNRKAKLWELYLQHFEAIRNEAQDDFQALFGKAFVAAYEQQLDRLRREKPPGA